MSEATIEYKDSPNESTAYAVSEGQKTKVQLVATPAGDLELADNPNVDTGYLVINGAKHKCALVAEVAGELKLPTSATDDTGYVTAQDGRQHKVKLVANITGGGAPATKFGVSVDNLLGDVDENGVLQKPTELVTMDLTGVKSFAGAPFRYFAPENQKSVEILLAPDLESIDYSYCFDNAFYYNSFIKQVTLGCKKITGGNVFNYAFRGSPNVVVDFPNLKVVSGQSVFYNAFRGIKETDVSKMFPVLEEISGDTAFQTFIDMPSDKIITFPSLIKITGATASYSATFYGLSSPKFYLPKCTTLVSKYIFPTSTTEIHFAAENQAAIEASENYATKWGATNASIIFDL